MAHFYNTSRPSDRKSFQRGGKPPMTETKKYTGSCHCGSVRFEVQGDFSQVISCNCSICARAAYLLTFVPEAQFTLLSGEDQLSDYQFNRKRIHHLFCKTCGIHSFGRGTGGDGKPMCAINVRCLEGLDPDELSIKKFDGRSL
jgi:hypothetical protein